MTFLLCQCCVLLENWNWDTWVGKEDNEEEEENTMEEDYQPNCEDPDFIVRLFLIEAQMQQQTFGVHF